MGHHPTTGSVALCERTHVGAVRFGHAWVIPTDAEKPKDGRSDRKNDKREHM